jgi:APA family basic amino acid/polyamine antiporter
VLATLTLVVTASLGGAATESVRSWDLLAGGWYGVLQSAGLLFFAFAGYARIATMGEEVREPERTIPRAILTALTVVIVIYLLVGVAILIALGPAGVAASRAPLAAAVDAAGWVWAGFGGLPRSATVGVASRWWPASAEQPCDGATR